MIYRGISLNVLPEFMRGSPLTLFAIILGYIVALIIMTILGKIIPRPETETINKDHNSLSTHQRLTRSSFFLVLSVFTIWGYDQLALLSDPIRKWQFRSETIPDLQIIGLGAIILTLSDNWIGRAQQAMSRVTKSFPMPKLSFKGKTDLLFYLGLAGLAVIMGFALNDPDSLGWKIIATILVLGFGYFLSHIVKLIFVNLLGIENPKKSYVAKFIFYLAFSTFGLTSIEIWLT